MRLSYVVLAFACTSILGQPFLYCQGPRNVHHVTVPLAVEGNAPIVTLSFERPGGGLRDARFIFDTGGGAIILDEGLATDLGLRPQGADVSEDGQRYRAVEVPTTFVGGMPVDLGTSKAFVHLGATSFDNRETVEGLLPGKALEHYQVILDYPQQLLSVGEAGTLPHRGEKIACPYIPSSGHPRVEVVIDGGSYGFLLDTGTKLTLVREQLLQMWSKQHLNWPRSTGAVGPANVAGAPDDALLLRIPAFQLGSLKVNHVATASRPNDTYSPTSYETPAAVVGALGGNVLSRFRVEIDYPEQLLFLEPSNRKEPNDFDTVGLVLDTNPAGQLVVRGVSPAATTMTRQNILPGDIIVQIGGFGRAPYKLTQAAQALSGHVGERKHLHILRQGKPKSITVVVSRIL
jgi:hypothetical protein